jgi:hypothetical protein
MLVDVSWVWWPRSVALDFYANAHHGLTGNLSGATGYPDSRTPDLLVAI